MRIPAGYVTAENNGTTNYYVPEGYRGVKNLLIRFSDEKQSEISDLNSAISTANHHHPAMRRVSSMISRLRIRLPMMKRLRPAMTSRLRRWRKPLRLRRRRLTSPARSWRL